jgi:hypothetical protein
MSFPRPAASVASDARGRRLSTAPCPAARRVDQMERRIRYVCHGSGRGRAATRTAVPVLGQRLAIRKQAAAMLDDLPVTAFDTVRLCRTPQRHRCAPVKSKDDAVDRLRADGFGAGSQRRQWTRRHSRYFFGAPLLVLQTQLHLPVLRRRSAAGCFFEFGRFNCVFRLFAIQSSIDRTGLLGTKAKSKRGLT